MSVSPLHAALAVADVPTVWTWLGLDGTPAKSCKSPLRDDRNPSFSVYDSGRKWRDHATGEGGDALDLVCAAANFDKSEASKWLIQKAGTGNRQGQAAAVKVATKRASTKQPEPPAKIDRAPKLDRGTYSDVLALQQLRSLPNTEGLELLIGRGILHFCTMSDEMEAYRAWLVTDGQRRNMQARRLDGHPWKCIGNQKTRSIKGSRGIYPVGIADAQSRETVLFCEGEADLLAAACAAYNERSGDFETLGFVAVTGASKALDPRELDALNGKTVRIYSHADKAGRTAAQEWACQLYGAGAAAVDIWESDREGEDLNDYVSRTFDRESLHTAEPLLPAQPIRTAAQSEATAATTQNEETLQHAS